MAKQLSFDLLEGTLSGKEGISKFARDSDQNEEYRRLKCTMAKVMAGELTPLQQECIRLYYYDGLTMEQVGQTLGVQKSSVSKVLHRARQRIEKVLRYSYEHRLS